MMIRGNPHVGVLVIRLADDDDLRPIKLYRDWDVDAEARTVFHVPTKIMFFIDCPLSLPGEPVRRSAITAHVAHRCDGEPLPSVELVQRIGKDAIHAFILCTDNEAEPAGPEIPF